MTRTFIVFLVGLVLAFALGGAIGYVLGTQHGAQAGYIRALHDMRKVSPSAYWTSL